MMITAVGGNDQRPMDQPAPPARSAPSAERVLACLDAFLGVQGQRAEAYGRFEEGFRAYLDAGAAAEGQYRQLIAATTAEFQALSQRVLALEAELRGPLARGDVAAALRAVQDGERGKLAAQLALQGLRASSLAHCHRRFSWQHAGHAGEGCGCEVDPWEPSRGEVDSARAEAVRGLEACVRGINDAIDEVRELREELRQELGEEVREELQQGAV